MENEKMFELATRAKLRFNFKGQVSVEDLWDLSLESLDGIYKGLNALVQQAKEDSLLSVKSAADEVLDAKIEIVKHIVKVKLEEAEARKQVKAVREQQQKIMSILSDKQDEALKNKTVEELQEMLKGL